MFKQLKITVKDIDKHSDQVVRETMLATLIILKKNHTLPKTHIQYGAHPQEQEQWSTNKPDYYILFILINLQCNAC